MIINCLVSCPDWEESHSIWNYIVLNFIRLTIAIFEFVFRTHTDPVKNIKIPKWKWTNVNLPNAIELLRLVACYWSIEYQIVSRLTAHSFTHVSFCIFPAYFRHKFNIDREIYKDVNHFIVLLRFCFLSFCVYVRTVVIGCGFEIYFCEKYCELITCANEISR